MRVLDGVMEGVDPGDGSAVMLRVSANNTDKLVANAETNASTLGHLPFSHHLARIGGMGRLLADDRDGDSLRRELGVRRVLRGDVHPCASEPGRTVGWMWWIPDARQLVLMVAASIGTDDLWVPGDPLPRNVAAELLVAVLMHPAIGALHLTMWDRIGRDEGHAARITSAALLGRAEIWVGTQRRDLYSTGGRIVSGVDTATGAGERTTIRDRTNRGVIGRLSRDAVAWPYATAMVPPGWRIGAVAKEVDDGGKRRRVATLTADVKNAAAWTQFYAAVAAGKTMLECGQILAEHRVPCRGVRLAGRRYHQLSDAALRDAARSLTRRRHLDALRHLTYTARVPVPSAQDPGDTTYWGVPIDYETDPVRYPHGSALVTATLPPHRITLTDAQYDAWAARLATRERRDTNADQPRRPLTGLPDWVNGRLQYRLTSSGSGAWTYYAVRERRLTAATDRRKRPRGWRAGEGTLTVSVSAAAADQALGRGIEAGARAIAAHTAVLHPLPDRDAPDPDDAAARRQTRLADLEDEIEDAADEVHVRESAVRERDTPSRRRKRDDARAALDTLIAEQQALQAEATASVEPVETVETVDLGTVAAVAGVLQASDGRPMARAVADAVAQLVRGTLRITVHPDSRRAAVLTAAIHLPGPDGEDLTYQVREVVPASSGRGTTDTTRGAGDAHLVLAEGWHIQRLVADGRSRIAVVDGAIEWLTAAGLGGRRTWQRPAILDCPIPETKAIVWALLTGTDLPAGVAPRFVALVRETYLEAGRDLRWTGTWARDVELARRVLGILTLAAQRGEDLADGISARDLARQAGVTTGEVLRLAGRSTSNAHYARVLDRHPTRSQTLRPRTCDTCGGWLLHIVRVPETRSSDGLICTDCCALPDGTPLPAGYLAMWDGPHGHHALRNAPATRLRPAGDYTPAAGPIPGAGRLIRIRDAAALAGVAAHVVRRWADTGDLPTVRTGRGRGKGSDRLFDPVEVERVAAAKRGHIAAGQYVDDAVPGAWLTLAQAADRLHVGVWHLRDLARSTPWDQGPLPWRYARPQGTGPAAIVVAPDDLDRLDPMWIAAHDRDLLPIGQAAARVGVSVHQLRYAAQNGQLPCHHTGTGRSTRLRFQAADVDQWRASHTPRKRPQQHPR